jgi:hypothetical protein
MPAQDEPASDPHDKGTDPRLAAVRAELKRDVVETVAIDALTALMDALDGYHRRNPGPSAG